MTTSSGLSSQKSKSGRVYNTPEPKNFISGARVNHILDAFIQAKLNKLRM